MTQRIVFNLERYRLRLLRYVYLGPSPGPNSCGDRFGSNRPFSFKLSNISSAFKMAWSMLKYL